MNKITSLFGRKSKNILNVYCTAGYPLLHSTRPVMKALQEHGADIIELGIPYSDPLADGPVIQHSSSVALANGMSIAILMEQLRDFRNDIHLPVVLMGYMNPVLQYGFEKFCADAAAAGIDGLILPDLPEFEFEKEYSAITRKSGLDFIFLITPETSEERVRKLDSLSSGFLYAVSASSTTGKEKSDVKFPVESESVTGEDLEGYLSRLKSMQLKNPVLVGFGIRDKAGFEAVCRYSEGGIIGSAYIKALENSTDVNASTKSFLSSILG